MNRKELFDKFISAGFGHVNNNDPQFWHHFTFYQKNFKDYLPTSKKARILEIGFGMGQFLFFLDQLGYSNFEGVEISKEMYDYSKKNVTKHIKLVSNIEAFLTRNRDSYDLIVMNDVIEHLEKDAIILTLKKIRGSLKKNGSILVKTNNVAAITGARMRFEDFTHETSFTPYSLRQVLLVSGFKDVSIKPFVFPVTGLFRFLRKVLQIAQHIVWRFMYWVEYTTQPEVVHEFIYAVAKK